MTETTLSLEDQQPVIETGLHHPSDQSGDSSSELIKTGYPCQALKSSELKDDSVHLSGSEKHMQNTVKAIGQGMKTACLQWEQLMVESEQFELFCPTRVDRLLQEAKAMEAHLLQQKEQLINRLTKLSQTLQVVP